MSEVSEAADQLEVVIEQDVRNLRTVIAAARDRDDYFEEAEALASKCDALAAVIEGVRKWSDHPGTPYAPLDALLSTANTDVILRARDARVLREAAGETRVAIEEALYDIESKHHIHGDWCLCGFSSARSRSRTEHITGLVREALAVRIEAAS